MENQDTRTKLRLAVMNLSCTPLAQRRYVQLGWLQRAAQTVEEEGGRAQELLEAGVIDPSQADLLASVREELTRLRESADDYMDERDAGTREYLYSHALEDESWHKVRHLARSCFTALRKGQEPSPAGAFAGAS